MTAHRNRKYGFTIVELLVVISVIGLLMAVLLPAIAGARNRARKVEEASRIRQVGVAWNLYSNANNDAALPGFVDSTQGQGGSAHSELVFDTTFSYPDKSPVPNDFAEEWPWRLMSYLDYSHDVVHGYLGEEMTSPMAMMEEEHAEHISLYPAFGYNAYYTGGWWEWYQVSDDWVPRMRFTNATIAEPGGTERLASVVVRSPSLIRDTSRYIVFCSSGWPTPEKGPGLYRETGDLHLGSHHVVPPFVAQTQMWGWGWREADTSAIEVFENSPFPIGRYTGQAMVLHADLHTAQYMPGAIADRSYWINSADRTPPAKSVWDHWSEYLHTD